MGSTWWAKDNAGKGENATIRLYSLEVVRVLKKDFA